MSVLEMFILALGLAMDAFAVAVCKGLAMPRLSFDQAACVGLWFGGFQAAMPLLGYFLGAQFSSAISGVDHWIAFVLLALIGGNMLREALAHRSPVQAEPSAGDASLSWKPMLTMAVATSIDALAVGLTFAFLQVRLLPAVTLIGAVTLLLSMLGVKLGHVFGVKYRAKAEMAGGIILVLLGAKILLEHLDLLPR